MSASVQKTIFSRQKYYVFPICNMVVNILGHLKKKNRDLLLLGFGTCGSFCFGFFYVHHLDRQ